MRKFLCSIILAVVLFCGSATAQTYSWKNVNLQGMGYVSGMAIHPTSNDIFIRTDVGGAYRYDAANNSWIPITDGKVASYNVEALALNPSNENEVFIIVGNNEAGKLYKSSDKGSTWQLLSNFSVNVKGNDPWRNDDPRLSVDPNNGGKVMFFASRANGLWKSTDSGVKWTQVSKSVIPAGTATSGGQAFVVFDKNSGNATTNSTTLYVGVAGNGVYKSINGGADFTVLSGGPTASTYNPVNTAIASDGTLYVTYCQGWNDGKDGKVYKFSTAGTATNITPATNNGLSFASIAVCKTDANKIVTWQWRWGEVKGIHYSTDAGSSWTAKTCSQANFNTPSWWDKNGALNWDYCGGIAFDPSNSNKIWFTSGHGVFYANDITLAKPVYNTVMKNLEELVALQVCAPPSPNTTHLYISCADQQGYVINNRDQVPARTMGSGGSGSCGGGFGITSSIDYCIADPNFVVRVADNEAWTSPVGYAQYSTNGGANWNCVASKPTDAAAGNIAISATNNKSWVWAPINSSGNNLNVMPYYTTNGGTSWTACTGITIGNNIASQQWSASKFLVSDKVNGSIFYYYSTENGNSYFYRSTNSGAAFTKISTYALPANWKIKMDAVPGKEGNLFLCAGSSLYKTIDSGSSWTTVPSVTSAYRFGFGKPISPSTEYTLFLYGIVSGNEGLFYSTNMGGSWTQIYGANIPGGCVDITGDYKEEYTIYVATGGRGVLYGVNSTNTSSKPNIEEPLDQHRLKIVPNPANRYFDVSFMHNAYQKASISLYNSSGKLILSQNSQLESGFNTLRIDSGQVQLYSGIYILKIQTGNSCLQEKVLINN